MKSFKIAKQSTDEYNETLGWMMLSEQSLMKLWNNKEDGIWNAYLNVNSLKQRKKSNKSSSRIRASR